MTTPGEATTAVVLASSEDEIDLPRRQAGPNPQRLLVTMLGDYWQDSGVPVPSAGLVALLSDFGISGASARSAISRLSRRGVLVASRAGRQTFYRLNSRAAAVGQQTLRRLARFGSSSDDGDDWDGTWLVVVFSVPDEQRSLRSALRSKLRIQRFAPLQDGVWVSAQGDEKALVTDLEQLGIENVTAFRSSLIHPQAKGGTAPIASWRLDELAEEYKQFITGFERLHDLTLSGHVSPAQALVVRTEVMRDWRGLYRHDPNLPGSLLPSEWPRRAAREIFVTLYDQLGSLAELRCRQLVAPHNAEAAARAKHFTIADIVSMS